MKEKTVSRDQFQKVMSDPVFRKKIDALVKSKENENTVPAWFQQNYPLSPLTCVAYFSMEFMLSEALPIYSGEQD
jgi:glycogen phosphorylase